MMANIWAKISSVGIILLGLLVSAYSLIRVGASRERLKSALKAAQQKAKITEKQAETQLKNREEHEDATKKADNDDWSGFNRKL